MPYMCRVVHGYFAATYVGPATDNASCSASMVKVRGSFKASNLPEPAHEEAAEDRPGKKSKGSKEKEGLKPKPTNLLFAVDDALFMFLQVSAHCSAYEPACGSRNGVLATYLHRCVFKCAGSLCALQLCRCDGMVIAARQTCLGSGTTR